MGTEYHQYSCLICQPYIVCKAASLFGNLHIIHFHADAYFFHSFRANALITELGQLLRNQTGPSSSTPVVHTDTMDGIIRPISGSGTTLPPEQSTVPTTIQLPFPSLARFQANRPDLVTSSLNRLFQPYSKYSRKRKPVTQPWEHTFFCCSMVNTFQIPDFEKSMCLQASGLGKKKVRFNDVQCTSQDFIKTLEEAFPPLRQSGGFKLMRCCRSKQLIDIVMPPEGYSINYLKNRSSLNKAVAYIVPLQCDLALNGDKQNVSNVNYFCVHYVLPNSSSL